MKHTETPSNNTPPEPCGIHRHCYAAFLADPLYDVELEGYMSLYQGYELSQVLPTHCRRSDWDLYGPYYHAMTHKVN